MVLLITVTAGCRDRRAAAPPAAPPVWGVPAEPLRFVSYNTFKSGRGRDRIIADVRGLNPDFVFMQEVLVDQADAIAKDLGMNVAFREHGNYPGEGIAVYSRFPLENVEAVQDRHNRTCAVLADTQVGNRQFTVAAVHLQATTSAMPDRLIVSDHMRGEELGLIHKARVRRGSRPIVIGGDFNQPPMGPNYLAMTASLTDALSWVGHPSPTLGDGAIKLRVDYLLCSNDWQPKDGGTLTESTASDHRPIWAVMKAKP